MKFLTIFVFALLFAAAGCVDKPNTRAQTKTPAQLVGQGAPVLDVRTPREFKSSHIACATNVPLDELEQRIAQVAPDKSKPVLVHCQSGGRSAAATEKLKALGYSDVVDLGSLAAARAALEPPPH